MNAATCTCGNFGCQKRIARGLAPFCRMDAPKATEIPGYRTFRAAAEANPGKRIFCIESRLGFANRFDVA